MEGEALSDLFVAVGPVVASALRGRMDGPVLRLEAGSARHLGDPSEGGAWTLRFVEATLPLEGRGRRVELVERSTASLRALVRRMEEEGRSAEVERMWLYKRTALPLAVPLLALLGYAVGARGGRPALSAAVTALSYWAVLRVCDQSVGTLGAPVAAGLPPVLLGAATVGAWALWRDR